MVLLINCLFDLCFLLVPEEHLLEFIEKKDHTVVLSVLRKFQDSENAVLAALQTLVPLAGPGKSCCSRTMLTLLAFCRSRYPK